MLRAAPSRLRPKDVRSSDRIKESVDKKSVKDEGSLHRRKDSEGSRSGSPDGSLRKCIGYIGEIEGRG